MMRLGQEGSRRFGPGLLLLFVLLLLLMAGWFLENPAALPDRITAVTNRLFSPSKAEPLPTLTLDIPFADYNHLLRQREAALASGVVLATEADFVPLTIHLGNDVVPGLIRLRQGTAVHLGADDKWNFDVRLPEGQTLAGLSRFYLLDPADNNWLYEWALAEWLRREGFVANQVQFVRLNFNGDDWGIYALQEGFGPELLAEQGPPGVIVEFTTDQLLQSIAHFGNEEAALADPVANPNLADFRFFPVDTFREAAIAADPNLAAQQETAVNLLRGLQQGELTASEVFDIEKQGRFLALIDLWGANDALALTNLRFFYNPETKRLEPIGFNMNPLAANDRIPLGGATFFDPAIQAAYVTAVQEISQPAYLDQIQAALEDDWQKWQTVVGPEASQEAPWAKLAARQTALRRSLDPIQPVYAYLSQPPGLDNNTIQVDVVNVLNLPLEIIGFDLNGATFLEMDTAWLVDAQGVIPSAGESIVLVPQESGNTAVLPVARFHIPLAQFLAQDEDIDPNQGVELQVATRLLGQGETRFTPVLADTAGIPIPQPEESQP